MAMLQCRFVDGDLSLFTRSLELTQVLDVLPLGNAVEVIDLGMAREDPLDEVLFIKGGMWTELVDDNVQGQKRETGHSVQMEVVVHGLNLINATFIEESIDIEGGGQWDLHIQLVVEAVFNNRV